MFQARPFKIDVPQSELDDLAERLSRTRWPGQPADSAWQYGANLHYMQRLIAYWRDEFDWRAAESKFNRFPQFLVPVELDTGEQIDIHYIREPGSGDRPKPLLLLHGWPGSIAEFLDFAEPLAHPERFGGHAQDGFDVIAPSLPGYGFSQAPPTPRGPRAYADILASFMTRSLGIERFLVQGGDWGSIIGAHLALNHSVNVAGLHVNMVPMAPDMGPNSAPLSEEEQAWLKQARASRRLESAYQEIQSTRGQTLAYGLTDSPVGLAGWITEKFYVWTDASAPAPIFSMDTLLTNISLYWFSRSVNTSTWLYRGFRDERSGALQPGQTFQVPLGLCIPPNDLFAPAPSSWVRRLGNVRHESRLAAGGHFTALEKGPELLEDVRTFFREVAL